MPFIGEVRMTGFAHAPAGWALCNGQILAVAQNTALFQVIGTTYGGNGVTTFALPDLRGRIPLGAGTGPGLTDRPHGEYDGSETHTLGVAELPQHNHALRGAAGNGFTDSPGNMVPARDAAAIPQYATTADASLAPEAVIAAGGSQPHNNLQPFLVVNYIIALQGQMP